VQDGSVGIMTDYGLDCRGSNPGGGCDFSSSTPTQPPIQWVPGVLSLVVKLPGREANHSPPSSTEIKEGVDLYLHSPNTSS
jgi:hypothetical protein